MRSIKVTFDIGGTWRMVTIIKVTKSLTITQSKKVAIDQARIDAAHLYPEVFREAKNVFAEVID